MVKHDYTDTQEEKLPSTPSMDVWEYEDDIAFPIILGLLFFVYVAAFAFCIIQAVLG